jgi:uncharacterized membrane protein
MGYTNVDALYDILVLQAPVPFVLAICFACQIVVFEQEAMLGSFFCCFSFFWVIVAVIILILDLLLLPPMFALLRIGGTLSHSFKGFVAT